MLTLYGIFFFVLGAIIGSFLNVVAIRYNTGRTFVGGQSSCPHCRHQLAFFELVPIFSFLILGGKCRKCHSKISWQYPAIELLTGLIFLFVYLRYIPYFSFLIPFSYSLLLLDLIAFSILIVILIYDLKHKIIPDGLVYSFIVLSLLKLLFFQNVFFIFHLPSTLDLLAGPILFLVFFLMWYLSNGRWMGLGDGKLALGIGWFLGFFGSLSAIILSFWIGAGVGIVILIVQKLLASGPKKITMKSEIPFAPFLILGLMLVYFFGLDVIGLHSFLP